MKLSYTIVQPVWFQWSAALSLFAMQNAGQAWAISPALALRIAMNSAERLGPSRLVSIDTVPVNRSPAVHVASPRQELSLSGDDLMASLMAQDETVGKAVQSPLTWFDARSQNSMYYCPDPAYRIWHWVPA
jgi:hypothetical protein